MKLSYCGAKARFVNLKAKFKIQNFRARYF